MWAIALSVAGLCHQLQDLVLERLISLGSKKFSQRTLKCWNLVFPKERLFTAYGRDGGVGLGPSLVSKDPEDVNRKCQRMSDDMATPEECGMLSPASTFPSGNTGCKPTWSRMRGLKGRCPGTAPEFGAKRLHCGDPCFSL